MNMLILPSEMKALAQADSKSDIMRVKQDHLDLVPGKASAPVPKLAANNTEEAAAYLKRLHDIDSRDYLRKCLVVQREARGIPALAPTAIAAAYLTPESERVYNISDFRRGMVAYCDDPYDSNEAGHIFFIIGRDKGNILTWTNDAKTPGAIDVVRMEFFERVWRDKILFAATWLNGYDFSDFNKKPEPVRNWNTLGDRYANAIEELIKIRENKAKHDGTVRVLRILDRDIARMEHHLEIMAA